MANLFPFCSASRTMPYVPAPRVRPNLYWVLVAKLVVDYFVRHPAERTSYRNCLAGLGAC